MSSVKKKMRKIFGKIRDRYLWKNIFFSKHYYYLTKDMDEFIQKCGHGTGNKRKMRHYLFRYGYAYDEYFFFEIEQRKNVAKEFITNMDRFKYCNMLNESENQIDFDDKSKTYDIFKKYYKRKLKTIASKEDFDAWCEDHSDFVIKPLADGFGNGVRIIRLGKDGLSAGDLWNELASKVPFVAEELIRQSSQMASLHPSSVNTVRISTILTGNAETGYEVHIFHPFLRIGQHGSCVDNGGAGGIICLIDDNGVLCTDGFDEHNDRYIEQPDTHITIKGFKLPDWDRAVNLCKEIALTYTKNRYIAFDMAHSEENGWVMVEANARGQFIGQQMCDKIGKKAELDLLCKNAR